MVGLSWLYDDGCNECFCISIGEVVCIDQVCPECEGGQVWNECGSECIVICDNLDPICIDSCLLWCECSAIFLFWDGTNCIVESDCGDPIICEYGGVIY